MGKKFNLQERSIDLAVSVSMILDKLQNNYKSKHLQNQIFRSVTSIALNYGEAQSAESQKDFIHKMKLVQKELRETNVSMNLIIKLRLTKSVSQVEEILNEIDQLNAIIYSSIRTAKGQNK